MKKYVLLHYKTNTIKYVEGSPWLNFISSLQKKLARTWHFPVQNSSCALTSVCCNLSCLKVEFNAERARQNPALLCSVFPLQYKKQYIISFCWEKLCAKRGDLLKPLLTQCLLLYLLASFHQALKEHAPKDSPRTPVVWWSTHLLLYELISFQINDIPIFWKYLTDLQLAMLPKTVKRRTRLPSHPDKITCKKNNWLHNPNYIWYFFFFKLCISNRAFYVFQVIWKHQGYCKRIFHTMLLAWKWEEFNVILFLN